VQLFTILSGKFSNKVMLIHIRAIMTHYAITKTTEDHQHADYRTQQTLAFGVGGGTIRDY